MGGQQQGSSRGSHIGAKVFKDSRNLSDKLWQREALAEIVDFLKKTDFPGNIPAPNSGPFNSSVFKEIFAFVMCNFIDESFEMPARQIELELPKVLKAMGYPLAVSKNTFQTLGTTHSWPSALGILHYLVGRAAGLMQWFENITEISFPGPRDEHGFDQGTGSDDLVTAEACILAYADFNNGKDDFEEHWEDMEEALLRNHNLVDLNGFEANAKKLRSTLEKLESDPRQSSNIEREHKEKCEDIDKLNKYFDDLKPHKAKMAKNKEALRARLRELDEEMKTLTLSVEKLREECKVRAIKGADSDEIRARSHALRLQIQSVKDQITELERTSWAKEMNLSRLNQQRDQKVRDFNSALLTLDQSAESSSSLWISSHDLNSDLVFQRLVTLRQEKKAELREAEEKLARLRLEKSKAEADNSSKTAGMDKLEADFKALTTSLEAKRGRIELEETQLIQLVKDKKTELTDLREREDEDLNHLRMDTRSAENGLDEAKRDNEAEDIRCAEYIKGEFTKAKNYVQTKEREVQQDLKDFKAKAKEEIEKDLALADRAETWAEEICAKLDKLDEQKK